MDLYPEQLRAVEYLKRRGTDAPADEIRVKVAESLGKFEAALAAVPAPLRQVSPGPGKWSVHEILDHLVESHRPALDQLSSLLQGQTPEGAAIPASLQSADPLSRPWDDLVADLQGIHREFLRLLEPATDSHRLDVRAPLLHPGAARSHARAPLPDHAHARRSFLTSLVRGVQGCGAPSVMEKNSSSRAFTRSASSC